MALTVSQLESIERFLMAEAAPSNIAAFRAEFPGVAITRCDASDVQDETPFRKHPLFDLYLLDARDHCVRLTTNPNEATGVVVAQRRSAGR